MTDDQDLGLAAAGTADAEAPAAASRRLAWAVAGLAALALTVVLAWLLVLRGGVEPISVEQAVQGFRVGDAPTVPLPPGVPVPESGVYVYGTRGSESVDIFPTLLDSLGVEPRHLPDGVSLTPFLDGAEPPGWRDAAHWEFDFREVASQASETHFGLPSTRLSLAVIRTERWKYVHFAALPPLLFDLEADPANLRNLAEEPAIAGIRLAMAERLLGWRAEHLDQTLALQELTPDGVVRRRS